MKMIAAFLLSVLAVPSQAQILLDSLQNYQKEIQSSNSSSNGTTEVKSDPIVKTKTSGTCTEEVQTSLPLAYITALILEKDGKLEIRHDSRSGQLTVKTPEMISNCSSMINWVSSSKVVDGKKIYSIEAKIKEGENCVAGECEYSVPKIEKGQFKKFEKIKLKNSMAGFENCLEQSGVVKDGKVVADAIYPSSVNEKFEGFKQTGDLVFVSHGLSSNLVKAKYDKFLEVDKCDFTEKITPQGFVVRSLEDEENERIDLEKKSVESCGDYHKIADFIEKYQGYADDLNLIRDNLILEAVKKSAKAITDGKYTEDDLKAIADFQKYIVQPKIDRANALYVEAQDLDAEQKKDRLDKMKAILTELAPYNQAPYISAALVQKLEAEGRFDDAHKTNGIKALIVSHARLGATENGVVITPEVAKLKVENINKLYAADLEGKKEKYEIRTGQTSGQARAYYDLSSRMRQNIQVRTQNFSQEINSEYARIQPGGFCYRPYRNTQRCIQDSQQRIQDLQAELQHYNKVDAERAVEYEQKGKDYAALEKEGREYVARQNGEPVPEVNDDYTSPTQRNDQGYNFEYQGYQQQPQQQQQQQGYNPYQQQQQQGYNPYQQQQQGNGAQFYMGGNVGANMGGQYGYYNQGFNPYQQQQGGYSFNYQGGQQPQQQPYNPYQQAGMFGNQTNPFQQQGGYGQGQQGYWGSPYQAYGNYNMYGGYR